MTILTDPKKRLPILLAIAGLALVLLLYTLLASEEEAEAPPAATAPPSAPAPQVHQPVAALMPGTPSPGTPPTAAAPATAPAPGPAVPAGSLEGMRLHGITSGAAIIGLPSGRQRLVRVGQQVIPGVTLVSISQQHAVLDLGSSQVRLTFQGPESLAAAPTGASQAQGQSGDRRSEERRYLLGMQPRTGANGAVTGYVVRDSANLPLLRQAGLREGDVLVSINGQAIDGQERLTQIPAELSSAATAEIEFERGGTRRRATIPLRR